MAITQTDYQVLLQLRQANIFPPDPAILELGESNWYGDVELQTLVNHILQTLPNPQDHGPLMEELKTLATKPHETALFDIVKTFYKFVFNYSSITSVDLNGMSSLRLDLNQPITLPQKYDIVINIGTGEHVFNTYQFFKTIHDYTKPSGLMIHAMPFHGWIDHGFYNFHPTFYFDLAGANNYHITAMLNTEISPLKLENFRTREDIVKIAQSGNIGKDTMIYAVFSKAPTHQEFVTPMQGYYFGNMSEEQKQSWQDLKPSVTA